MASLKKEEIDLFCYTRDLTRSENEAEDLNDALKWKYFMFSC